MNDGIIEETTDSLFKCIRCKDRKSLGSFDKREGHTGYRKVCKECCDKQSKDKSNINYKRKEIMNWNDDAIYC